MTEVMLNIGAGIDIKPKEDGWVNIDYKPGFGIDLVIDFNSERLSDYFKADSVGYIYCSHFLEHIINPVVFMFDCLSVLKKDGGMLFKLPNSDRTKILHFRNRHGKQYMNEFQSLNNRSLQVVDGVVVKSYPSTRNGGFIRFLLNNFWDFEAWLERRFWDEYTYEFRKK